MINIMLMKTNTTTSGCATLAAPSDNNEAKG